MQTRHLSGVRAPLVSRGQAQIAAQRVDWHVTDPLDVRTVITPSGVTQSVEGGPAQRMGAQGGEAFLSTGLLDLLSGDIAAMRRHYNISRRPNGAGGSWTLRLTPRAPALARQLSSIDIAGCERVNSVEVLQANGDRMQIALTPARR
ncbi:outer membrane lipoprotein carrier protein LolA [Brevundimonas sp. FT23028]|uniref:outer membrane lipoprotein carrier protein LolA n=1 Tax=Brevundimonas sp. FT23028 TaxID=3393748 RepID=UPI003B58825C